MKLKIPIIFLSMLLWWFLVFQTFGYENFFGSLDTQNQITKKIEPKSLKIWQNLSSKKCIKAIDWVKINTYIFHYIIPDQFVNPKNKIEYGNSLSPRFFEWILKKIYNERLLWNIEVINLQNLDKYYKNDCFPNKNIVILTADDGWDDNYNFLFPLVQKYQIPFNLAIISSKVSKTPAETNNFANEYELKEMLNSGLIQLASHTIDHFDLRRIDIKQKEHEICDSKIYLESLFNIKINSLVYPSGKYDPDSEILAKKCGYSFGFSTWNKPFDASEINSKPFEITRVRVNRKTNINDLFSFKNKVWTWILLNPENINKEMR